MSESRIKLISPFDKQGHYDTTHKQKMTERSVSILDELNHENNVFVHKFVVIMNKWHFTTKGTRSYQLSACTCTYDFQNTDFVIMCTCTLLY